MTSHCSNEIKNLDQTAVWGDSNGDLNLAQPLSQGANGVLEPMYWNNKGVAQNSCVLVDVGPTSSQRIGREIFVHSFEMTMQITLEGHKHTPGDLSQEFQGNVLYTMLVLDTQSNGGSAKLDAVLQRPSDVKETPDSTVTIGPHQWFRRKDNEHRFKVLHRGSHSVRPLDFAVIGTGAEQTRTRTKSYYVMASLMEPILYSAIDDVAGVPSNTTKLSNVRNNNLLLYAWVANPNMMGARVTVAVNSRLSFED